MSGSLGRRFHLLWAGESVSLLGNATTTVVIPLVAVVELGAGAGWTAALTAVTWLPWLVVGLPAGAWVDRRSSRRVMIAADLAAAAAVLSVPVAWVIGQVTLLHLVGVAALNGIATVFFRAAYPRLMAEVVRPDGLESANGRMFGSDSASQVVGPGLGGLLVQVVGGAQALVLDAVSFCASAWCLWRIDVADDPPRETRRTSLRAEVAEGVAFVRRDPVLRTFLVVGAISNFGLTGYGAVSVVFLVQDLGLSASGVGVVVGLGAVGGVVGAVTAPFVSRCLGSGLASTVLLGVSGPAALLVPCGLVLGPPAAVVGLSMTGGAVVAGNVIRNAWRQAYVPAALMARVTTTSQVINFGSMPIAAGVAGVLATTVGVPLTATAMLAVHAVAALGLGFTRVGRLRILPLSGMGNLAIKSSI